MFYLIIFAQHKQWLPFVLHSSRLDNLHSLRPNSTTTHGSVILPVQYCILVSNCKVKSGQATSSTAMGDLAGTGCAERFLFILVHRCCVGEKLYRTRRESNVQGLQNQPHLINYLVQTDLEVLFITQLFERTIFMS